MKGIKKVCCWIGVLTLSFLVFAGCGEKKDHENTTVQNSVEEKETSSENSAKTQGEIQEESQNVAEDALAAPVLLMTEHRENRYTEEGTLLVEGYFQTLEVSGEGYEYVAASVSDWFAGQEEAFLQTVALYEEYALEALEYTPEFTGYSSYTDCVSTRADGRVISLKCLCSDYSGGAHGNYGSVGAVFDVKTGEKLSFWDLADEKEKFARQTLEACLSQLQQEYAEGLYGDYEEILEQIWEGEPNWYLDAAGITVIFNPYEIGPYAMGEVYVTLPYEMFSETLYPGYQMGKGTGVSVLPENISANVYLAKETGEAQSICIRAEELEAEYGFRTYWLELDEDKSMELAQFDWLASAYLVRREDGRSFLLLDGDMASDDYLTYIYELTDGQVKKTYESPGFSVIRKGTVTPEGLNLGIRIDALGTYTAYGDYEITTEGKLEPSGEWYAIETSYEGQILTTIRELPVVVEGQKTLLPEGSEIRITGTDGKEILGFRAPDSGLEGEIHFTKEGWQVLIEGINENEYFEMLPYAG